MCTYEGGMVWSFTHSFHALNRQISLTTCHSPGTALRSLKLFTALKTEKRSCHSDTFCKEENKPTRMGRLSNILEDVQAMFKERKSIEGGRRQGKHKSAGAYWCQQRGHYQPRERGDPRARQEGSGKAGHEYLGRGWRSEAPK